MPHLPRLKLCETCDQVSFVRGTSRDLQCQTTLPPPLTGKCRSRQVRPVLLKKVNRDRRAWRETESRVRTLQAAVDNHEARLGEQEEVAAEQRAAIRDLAARVEAAEARALAAEERAEAFRRELLRGGLRPGDLR